MAGENPNVSAQQAQVQPIEYDDREGSTYREVHGDHSQNITVESVAEKEGMTQPNAEGTTPDPFNPEPTRHEVERLGDMAGTVMSEEESEGLKREITEAQQTGAQGAGGGQQRESGSAQQAPSKQARQPGGDKQAARSQDK